MNHSSRNLSVAEMGEELQVSTKTPVKSYVKLKTGLSDTKPAPIHSGYGACSASGCICSSYAGSGPLCTNCTHSYEQHW